MSLTFPVRGEGDRPVVLKWNEYASGAYIKGVRFPEDRSKADRSGESTRPPDDASARRSASTEADRGGRIYGTVYASTSIRLTPVWPERVPLKSTAPRNSIAEWSSQTSTSVITEEVNVSN